MWTTFPSLGDTGPHVENIFWPDGGAPAGDYQAWVEHYSGSPSSYRLIVRRNGERIHTEEGTLGPGEESPRFSFSCDTNRCDPPVGNVRPTPRRREPSP